MDHRLSALRDLLTRVIGDGAPFARIRAILSALEKEASGISELQKHPDPLKSGVAIDLLVNAEKQRLRDLIAKSRSEADALVSGFRAAQEAARRAKANLVPDQYAAETRQIFKSLDTVSRTAFLAAAIKAEDAASAAALLSAPPILSGLTKQQSEEWRERFMDAVAGPSAANVCNELQAVVDTALQVAESLARPEGVASAIAGQMAASLAARAA